MATQRRLPRVPEVPETGAQEKCEVVLAEGDLKLDVPPASLVHAPAGAN